MSAQTTASNPPLALLVADTDETQAYVFESNKLPEIRGASLQLQDLNDDIGELVTNISQESPVYAGGGSLIAFVPLAQAPHLQTQIEEMYPTHTTTATITADWREVPASYQEADFLALYQWAGFWLRKRKESKPAPPFVQSLPFQTRCYSCHKRPAAAQYLSRLIEWPICPTCHRKRHYGGRKNWFIRFAEWLAQPEPQIASDAVTRSLFSEQAMSLRQCRQKYYGKTQPQEMEYPQAIDEIAQASQGKPGYVAFIYMDGDGIGKKLQTIQGREAFQQISQHLEAVTKAGVFYALAAHLTVASVTGSETRAEMGKARQVGQPVQVHPFEIITIGGDDVLLIVPAHVAVPIAVTISQIFAKGMAAWELTMSAGVVIADDHTPVRVMVDLAKQLLKEAKKIPAQAKENGIPSEGGIDFQVLKSADMLATRIDEVRHLYPYRFPKGDKGKQLALIHRPYTCTQMASLWHGLQALKEINFPTTQMNLLAESLLDGRSRSTLYYLYQYQRNSQQQEKYRVLEKVLEDIHQKKLPQDPRQKYKDPLIWQTVQDEAISHRTALWDMAELYAFVGGNNG